MDSKNPLVSIAILSYNRADDLQNTLKKVLDQDYKNIEVIVIDNASSDGTVEIITKKFPTVDVISLPKNIGVVGMNEGLKKAKGIYVLLLDDDSYPIEGSIASGVQAFSSDNKLGVVAFKIVNSRNKKIETDYFVKSSKYFIGCGALVSAELFSRIGYYNESYFLYYNELDFSARCHDAGYSILYLENDIVIHNQSLRSRGKNIGDPFTSEHHYYYHFISYSIFLLQSFDMRYTMTYLLKYFINRSVICVFYGYYQSFFKGAFYIVKNSRSLRRKGKRLKSETQRLYDYGNIAFIDRAYFPSFK